jgi:hypothetical protein
MVPFYFEYAYFVPIFDRIESALLSEKNLLFTYIVFVCIYKFVLRLNASTTWTYSEINHRRIPTAEPLSFIIIIDCMLCDMFINRGYPTMEINNVF